ncbi:MAG: hypothetical protein JXX14_20010 [Deltaproteobacteria bacterium]|nr:hypothetical protein [Deltaproteobacteria bacterium]
MQAYKLLILTGLFLVPAVAGAGLFDDAVSGGAEVTSPNTATANGDSNTPEKSTADIPPSVSSPLKFDLNGYVRGDMFVGKMPEYSRAEIKNGYGELALKVLASKGSYGSAFGDVRFKGGYLKDGHYLGQPSDNDPADEDNGKAGASVQLREAYVNMYFKHLELRLGHQIVLWGRADGINPTNNITPIDMRVRSPEEDDRRLANTGLVAKLNLSPVTIEGVWMPVYNASIMPQVVIADALLFDRPDYPDFDLANGLFAGKVDFAFSAFEFSLSYLNGYALTPGIAYVRNNFSDSYFDNMYDNAARPKTVTLARSAYRHQVIGFDFETTLKSIGLRGEVAFRYPEKQKADDAQRVHIPNPDLYYVLGADKEFGNLMVVAQYIGRYTLNYDKRPRIYDADMEDTLNNGDGDIDLNNLDNAGTDVNDDLVAYAANRELAKTNAMIHGQTQEVQHGVSLRLSYSLLHDTLSLVTFAMANLSTREIVVYPKIQYKVTDAMTLTAGAELYFGPDDTLFGLIDETLSAGYTELKISF